MEYSDIWDIKNDIKEEIGGEEGDLDSLVRRTLKRRKITSRILAEMAVRWLVSVLDQDSRTVVRGIEKASVNERFRIPESFEEKKARKNKEKEFICGIHYSTWIEAESYKKVLGLLRSNGVKKDDTIPDYCADDLVNRGSLARERRSSIRSRRSM
ncbi:MAG: hypothetical protein ABIF82_07985 [Planctomycetota bacterium]